jgi:hypothetical protein
MRAHTCAWGAAAFGFRAQGEGVGIQGFGFRVGGKEFRVWGLRLRGDLAAAERKAFSCSCATKQPHKTIVTCSLHTRHIINLFRCAYSSDPRSASIPSSLNQHSKASAHHSTLVAACFVRPSLVFVFSAFILVVQCALSAFILTDQCV